MEAHLMTKEQINVKKRNRRGIEYLDLNKIHVMVEEACKGVSGVSASQVEIQSQLQFYDGITTADIQEMLIKSAADLISLDHPNYQFVAAKLLLFSLRKSIYHKMWECWTLQQQIEYGISLGCYDPAIIDYYSPEELEILNSYIDHDRDMKYTYAGLRQLYDKYLIQDRTTGKVFETPQFMYMLIAATIFHGYPQETRLSYVKKYYEATSKHYINLPTPIMSGVRTNIRQYASCVLIDIDDTLDSIFASDMAIGRYTAQRAGIGINVGRIRALGSRIRDGEVQHTGVIPFLKKFEATVRCCTQNGVRGGSATVYFPIWHKEIEDVIVLKNNKGTENNRVRNLDYAIQMSKLFYERYITDGFITLFSPHDVPGLHDAFGLPGFDDLYIRYEEDPRFPKITVKARELFNHLVQERAETGRIYIMNIDHCNTHSSYTAPIRMSNLCCEITIPTKPIQHIDDPKGEIALCILSAINIGKIKHLFDLKFYCDLSVRALDALIDYQHYPVESAEIATKARRSLGIGFIGLAHYLAKCGLKYNSKSTPAVVDALCETFQYYLIESSCELAKEKGACDGYDETKYVLGQMPIDHYKKDVDEVWAGGPYLDWDSLREKVKMYGLRNSTLSSQMPSESSSVVSNETNGIEPPRDYLSIKISKKGTLRQIVPQYNTLKNEYTLAWDMETMEGYLKIVAIMQKYFDQSISANTTYNPLHFENHQVPASVIIGDILQAYKLGIKTLYYQNTYDSKGEEEVETPTIDKETLEMLYLSDNSCEACAI